MWHLSTLSGGCQDIIGSIPSVFLDKDDRKERGANIKLFFQKNIPLKKYYELRPSAFFLLFNLALPTPFSFSLNFQKQSERQSENESESENENENENEIQKVHINYSY